MGRLIKATQLLAEIEKFKLNGDKNIFIPTNNQKRQGWPEAFEEMAKNGDDELLIPDVFEDEDLHDWT